MRTLTLKRKAPKAPCRCTRYQRGDLSTAFTWDRTPCAALSGLSALWPLNPGLAPWAVLLDPFGVLGFAPETSLGLFRMWKAVSNGRSLRSSPPSPLNERLPLFEALKSGNGISLLSANHTLPI